MTLDEPATDRPYQLPTSILVTDLAKNPSPMQHGVAHMMVSPGTPSKFGQRANIFVALVTYERPTVLSIWQLHGPTQSEDADVFLWPHPKCVSVLDHPSSISHLAWRPLTPQFLVSKEADTVETSGWMPDRLTWICGEGVSSWEWREDLVQDESVRMDAYGIVECVQIPVDNFSPCKLCWGTAPTYLAHPHPLAAKDDDAMILGAYTRPLLLFDDKGLWCLSWTVGDEEDAALEQQVELLQQDEIEEEVIEQDYLHELSFDNSSYSKESEPRVLQGLVRDMDDLQVDEYDDFAEQLKSGRSSYAGSILGAYMDESGDSSPKRSPIPSGKSFTSPKRVVSHKRASPQRKPSPQRNIRSPQRKLSPQRKVPSPQRKTPSPMFEDDDPFSVPPPPESLSHTRVY